MINIELSDLPVHDDRYIKTKIRTYSHKVYTNFCGINVPEDGAECESFTIVSFDFLLVCKKKYYLQVYLDNCAYKYKIILMTIFLKLMKSSLLILINGSYKYCIMIDSI